MSTCIILNPKAGGGLDPADLRERLACIADAEVRETSRECGARECAAEAVAAGCDTIISAGGDGTLNGVLNGIAPDFDRVTLGVLPLGTANDFCRSIAVPDDLDDALQTLCARRTAPIDVVRVVSSDTRYFINVAAAGFSGLLHENLTPEIKEAWGPLAYLRSGIATLPDLTAYATTIILDGEMTLDTSAYNLIIANARFAAGGLPVAPQARLDDGLLDLIVVPETSLPRLAQLTPLVLAGMHLESELVAWHRAAKIELSSTPGMWFNCDGELVGNEPATFQVLPRALQVIVGAEWVAGVDDATAPGARSV